MISLDQADGLYDDPEKTAGERAIQLSGMSGQRPNPGQGLSELGHQVSGT